MSCANGLIFKQKEAKSIIFTCLIDGAAVDLSTAVLSFMMKLSKDDLDIDAKITKDHGAFVVTNASIGIVSLPLSTQDLDQVAGEYIGELRIYLSGFDVDKSDDIPITIEQSVLKA